MYQTDLVDMLRKYKSFHPVLPFDPVSDKLLSFDFTAANDQLSADVLNDINKFCRYIDDQLADNKAIYGIGGYAEHRTIYSRSNLFDAQHPGEEPRRLHLGIDVWGKAGTPISAPLDGRVHSFAFNDKTGDYGTTIILSHQLNNVTFFTLYGHLDLASIKNLQEGNEIKKGEIFTTLGVPAENGHWPPHLHFQLIKNLEGRSGDYPGVCKFSEREYYLQNCPDPDLILQMNKYVKNLG
ncbi:MAG: peptidoglycan DD-metalloendopeptidase family protein [Chitinophagaceae bacterium]